MKAFASRSITGMIAWLTRRQRGSHAFAPDTNAAPPMSLDDLADWAERNDMALVDRAELEDMCARAAAAMVDLADIDHEYRVLLGDV